MGSHGSAAGSEQRRALAVENIDLRRTLGVQQQGPYDPTTKVGEGEAWRATRTPEGPATLHLRWAGGRLDASGWGAGATWLLDRVAGLVGLHDDPAGLVPRHEAVAAATRLHPGVRSSRSDRLWHALLPAILGQRVTGRESTRQWASLCHHLSEPAPGPDGLLLPPDPVAVAAQPSWWYHRLGIERRRADTLRRAASSVASLERLTAGEPGEAIRLLQTVPGIGPWTAAKTIEPAMGDPDALALGDFHFPHMVTWALAGEPRGDDRRMLELLAPYVGHRARVVRLLAMAGWQAPKFGPRRAITPIAAL